MARRGGSHSRLERRRWNLGLMLISIIPYGSVYNVRYLHNENPIEDVREEHADGEARVPSGQGGERLDL